MKSIILALATAIPQYGIDQSDLAQKIINFFKLEKKSAEHVNNLYNKTQIKRRYSVMRDIQKECNDGEFFNEKFYTTIPGTQQRNDIYIREAPKLALTAAQNAIAKWKRDPKDITHIISVSCTGVMAPGIEFLLQKNLGLKDNVQRIGINFMGCFGAFKGLAVANALAKEDPKNRILLVCTELCSLHFQVSSVPEILVGNALFADGAAASIIGGSPEQNEKSLFMIEKFGSYALENTTEKMTWKLSDHGCVMNLAKDIPSIIEQNANKKVGEFLNSKNFNDFTWAIHPGGKSIIQAIESSCKLSKEQTKSSWDVLANFGNMSSATFLFVLEELLKINKIDKPIIGIGFGPGLSFETILLNAIK